MIKCYSLRWRHNERDGVSDHQPRDCLLNRLFRRRWKKTPKIRVTGLCVGNSPVTGEFPAHKGQWRRKCFHLMMSSWMWRTELHSITKTTLIQLVDQISRVWAALNVEKYLISAGAWEFVRKISVNFSGRFLLHQFWKRNMKAVLPIFQTCCTSTIACLQAYLCTCYHLFYKHVVQALLAVLQTRCTPTLHAISQLLTRTTTDI